VEAHCAARGARGIPYEEEVKSFNQERPRSTGAPPKRERRRETDSSGPERGTVSRPSADHSSCDLSCGRIDEDCSMGTFQQPIAWARPRAGTFTVAQSFEAARPGRRPRAALCCRPSQRPRSGRPSRVEGQREGVRGGPGKRARRWAGRLPRRPRPFPAQRSACSGARHQHPPDFADPEFFLIVSHPPAETSDDARLWAAIESRFCHVE
jgi:hypothetical protein